MATHRPREQERDGADRCTPTRPRGASLRTAPTGADGMLRLQAAAGNRAVAALLRSAQRQASTTGPAVGAPVPEPQVDPARDLDVELAALLDQIGASLPVTPEVPTFEVITGTTAAQYSTGELERRISRSWRRERLDFTDAARLAAEADRRGSPRVTASPAAPAGTSYGLRWAVNLLAADYRGRRSDLPDVARLLRRGSPFQRSLRGEFAVVRPVPDPTADEIRGAVMDAAFDMWHELPPGTIGELVVTFSGHGGNGILSGVDWEDVRPAELRDLATNAAALGVHVVYVVDTCRAGTLTQFARGEALARAAEDIDRLPPGERAYLGALREETSDLGNHNFRLGQATIEVGDALRQRRRRNTEEHRLALVEALFAHFDRAHEQAELLRAWVAPPGTPDVAPLLELLDRLLENIIVALGLHPGATVHVLRGTAPVLDETGELINRLVAHLAGQVRRAGAGAAR